MEYQVDFTNRANRDLYRVIFRVVEEQKCVLILTIRHSARRKVKPIDLA